MPLTIAQLNDPKEEELAPVWSKLLELLKGVSRDELKQMEFRGMEILPYPELHEESIVEMGMLKELLDLCQKTGVFDVTLSDIVTPEKGRLRRILSALINFAKFREDKLEVFSTHTSQSQALLELRTTEEVAVDELERQRMILSEQHESIKPQIASVQVEVETLQGQLQTLVSEQHTLRDEMKNMKGVSSELSEKISELQVEIVSIQGENVHLKSQILPEPDKLKGSLKDMTNRMHQGRSELLQQSSKLKMEQVKLVQLQKLEEKLTKRVELLNSFSNEQQSVLKLRKLLQEQTEKGSELSQGCDDLGQQESSLKENITQAQEKLFSLQQSFESKRLTATQALEQVLEERSSLEKLLATHKSQQEQNEMCMQIKRQQLQALQQEHARTMGNLRGKYVTLQQAVSEYHDKLAIVMNQA